MYYGYVYSYKTIHSLEQSSYLRTEGVEYVLLQCSRFGVDCLFSWCLILYMNVPRTMRDMAGKHICCCNIFFLLSKPLEYTRVEFLYHEGKDIDSM